MDDERLNLLISLNRFRDAEKVAREAIGADPQWAHGYSHLARALLGQDKYPDAEHAAREGIRKAPHDAWTHAVLGVVLNCRKKYKDAHRAGLDALRLWPDYPLAHRVIADAAAGLKQFKVAALAATDGLAHDPTDEGLLTAKAWAEFHRGRLDEAETTVESALATHPESADLLNLFGCVRWEQARQSWRPRTQFLRFRDADSLLSEAVRRRPTEPAFRNNRRANALAYRSALLGWFFAGAAAVSLAAVVLIALATGWKWEKFGIGLTGVVMAFLLCTRGVEVENALAAIPLGWTGAPPISQGWFARGIGLAWFGLIGFLWLVLTAGTLAGIATEK